MRKVELHLHLDCSLSYSVVSQLAPHITRAQYEADFIAPPKCSSLLDYLARTPAPLALMQTEDALCLVVEDLFQQLAADNLLYAEIRFAPLLHLEQGLSAEKVVEVIDRATEACIAQTGIEARLILCTLRHYTQEQSLQTAKLVEQFRNTRVAALDIAADEAGYPITAHIPAFQYAIEKGLHRTAHAGEARGADSVWETLRAFQPTRIGHGVRSIEDPALVQHLAQERIHLEVCPSSNVQTNTVVDYASHPIDKLYKAGVSLSVNTDARTITNITLEQEYNKLREAFSWTDAELLHCNREALRAAFIDDKTRTRLLAKLNQP
jgi:adenosine deaminase